MADLDLSLSDALTDSVPPPGPEGPVERDFVAQLEAETFDDQVKESVGKTDYIPLLDNDDTKTDAASTLENGEQEAHGVQKPDWKLSSGGPISASHREPQGGLQPPDQQQQQASAPLFLSGFSQPGGIGMNMEVGAAPLHAEKSANLVDLQHPPAGLDAPKLHSPMLPEPQAPRSPQDLSAGAFSCWSAEPPFTPSVSVMLAKQAGHPAASPEDPHQGWPGRESAAYAGGDEKDAEGSDRKQKKKKKRRQKDEGSGENLDHRGPVETPAQGEEAPPAEDFYHRIGPRRERADGGWEEQLGKSGGRGKRGKNRKKIPEEWAPMADPSSASQMTEAAMMDLESSAQSALEASFTSMDSSKNDVTSEEDLLPAPPSQGAPPPAAVAMSPLVLNSELKATAAPFTMPPTAASFPPAADPFSLLLDSENSHRGLCPPFPPGPRVFEGSSSFQQAAEGSCGGGDTSAFSPASQTGLGLSPEAGVLASAPPLSPSDASWLLNDSHLSSNSELFDLSEASSPGPPLPLGLSFDTPSPAPLRSPKTTAQEFQPREHREAKSPHNPSKKSRSSSSSSSLSSTKSPTSLEAQACPPQASPAATPSSPPPVSPPGAPGSGLNPAAKPFFPSFADPGEDPAVVPVMEVKSDKTEKLEEDVKKVEPTDFMSEPEQRGVKVEYASTDTPAKGEKVIEKDKEKENTESKRLKDENQADNTKDTEKKEEKANDQETEKGKETKRQKDEFIQPRDQKEDKMHKEEASNVNMGKPEKLAEVEMMNKGEKADSVEKMEKTEKSKVEEKLQGAEAQKSEVKEDKEQHPDRAETTPAPKLTPVKPHASGDVTEKMAEGKMEEKEELKTERADKEETEKTEDEASRPEPPAGKVVEKTEKEEKPDKSAAEKKADKKEKPAKADGAEKAKRAAKPPGSTAPSRDPPAADRKTKPAAGGAKPGTAAKVRPTNMAAGVSATAIAKRPAASSNPTPSDKKPSAPKAPSTIPVGPKRPSATSISRLSSSTSTTREVKPKVTTEKRPLVPKVSTATSNPSGSSRTGTASRAPPRPPASARPPAAAAPARKPLATKTESKPGEEKKPGTVRTTTVDSPKPRTTAGPPRSTTSSSAAARPRPASAKAAPAASGPAAEKKPLVPRVPRAAPPAAARPPAARPASAPAPDIRNARSKIGSTDNMKHQPGGGKVSSASQSREVPTKESSQSKVQILNKKVDLSKVTSKCGSKDNIKHKPGGGIAKTDSHKVSFREKAQSKVSPTEGVSHSAGGGDVKTEGVQETTGGAETAPAPAPAPAPGPGREQVGSPAAQKNGLNDVVSCDGEALREPQALDPHIPETN